MTSNGKEHHFHFPEFYQMMGEQVPATLQEDNEKEMRATLIKRGVFSDVPKTQTRMERIKEICVLLAILPRDQPDPTHKRIKIYCPIPKCPHDMLDDMMHDIYIDEVKKLKTELKELLLLEKTTTQYINEYISSCKKSHQESCIIRQKCLLENPNVANPKLSELAIQRVDENGNLLGMCPNISFDGAIDNRHCPYCFSNEFIPKL